MDENNRGTTDMNENSGMGSDSNMGGRMGQQGSDNMSEKSCACCNCCKCEDGCQCK